jgi:glycerate kinase
MTIFDLSIVFLNHFLSATYAIKRSLFTLLYNLPMKILIAPDSFKGSLSSKQACDAIEEGLHCASENAFEIAKIPIADGGEGTVEAFLSALGGQLVNLTVTGPLGESVPSFYGILLDGTAVIEMAAASGLNLVPPDKRNPLITTTYGVGQLIEDGLGKGCVKFIVGLGGSATNDGGAGMLQALGIKLLDKNGQEIPWGGGNLDKISTIDLSGVDPRLKSAEFTVACDVDNPLCGENGASAVYGPQKGATADMVKLLDRNLSHFADVVSRTLGEDHRDDPGAEAAGGLGFAFKSFFHAQIRRGIDIVMETTHMEEKVKWADLVITGEGKADFQTARFGKAPAGVARLAKHYGKPVLLIAGSLGEGYEELYNQGVTAAFSITNSPMTLEEAMESAYSLLADKAQNIGRLLVALTRLS